MTTTIINKAQVSLPSDTEVRKLIAPAKIVHAEYYEHKHKHVVCTRRGFVIAAVS